jgi:LysM repeat protein
MHHYYVVQRGDTLSGIADEYEGDFPDYVPDPGERE